MSEEDTTPAAISKEEEVYTLLFQECNVNGAGWASVDSLVDTIQQMLPSSPKKDETVYDSDENVKEAIYNLDLLRCMLDNHSINGEINQVSYVHVIRNWVKDLRSRSASPASEKSLEVSHISAEEEDEESQDGMATCLFQESFETTGGSSCHEMDHQQLINTVSELQFDNKRLTERNQRLLVQIEGVEESARQVNDELENKVKSQQQNSTLMENLRQEKEEITRRLIDEEQINEDLKQQIEGKNHSIVELQSEISDLQNNLTSYQTEKNDLVDETTALKVTLQLKEEELAKIENERSLIESHLEEQNHETITLQHALSSTEEAMEELRSENNSLQTQMRVQPISSTPFRPQAPSLREELAESGITDGMSPVMPLIEGMDHSLLEEKREEPGELFSDITDRRTRCKEKFEQKTTLMKQQLSDLIDTPLTSLGADKSKMTESFTSNKENEEEFQIKLSKIESAKRRDRQKSHKLSEDLNCLRKEHEVLKERCQQLEGEVKKQSAPVTLATDIGGGVEPSSSDVHLLLTSPPPPVQERALLLDDHECTTELSVNDKTTVSVQTDVGEYQETKEGEQPNVTTPTTLIDTTPTLLEYQSLQSEVVHLREQLHVRTALEENRETTPCEEEREMVDERMTSACEESRLESILQQRKPCSDVHNVTEESFTPSGSRSCLSSILSFLYSVLKGSICVLAFLMIIFVLVIVLVNFNSTIGRCGGSHCTHSPLHMLLGQHLKYSHEGEVPL